MKKKKLVILSHLYYDAIQELLPIYQLSDNQNNLLFNICSESIKNNAINDSLNNNFPNSYITTSSNKGKDIGGKLVLIDLCLKLNVNADYYIFLHDKQSPHTTLGQIWKDKLFRIIEPTNIDIIVDIFEKDKNIGIVASKEFIINEYDKKNDVFNCSSNLLLKELISKYSLTLKTYDFVGGTMFWIRSEIINSFFKKYNPLDIRATLEYGNVLDHDKGTITHSWERLLSWIAIDQGYYIKGI